MLIRPTRVAAVSCHELLAPSLNHSIDPVLPFVSLDSRHDGRRRPHAACAHLDCGNPVAAHGPLRTDVQRSAANLRPNGGIGPRAGVKLRRHATRRTLRSGKHAAAQAELGASSRPVDRQPRGHAVARPRPGLRATARRQPLLADPGARRLHQADGRRPGRRRNDHRLRPESGRRSARAPRTSTGPRAETIVADCLGAGRQVLRRRGARPAPRAAPSSSSSTSPSSFSSASPSYGGRALGDDRQPAAALEGQLRQPGDRVDGERGADAEHQLGPLGELAGPRHRALGQQLAEEDDVGFDRAAAARADRDAVGVEERLDLARARRRRRSGCRTRSRSSRAPRPRCASRRRGAGGRCSG